MASSVVRTIFSPSIPLAGCCIGGENIWLVDRNGKISVRTVDNSFVNEQELGQKATCVACAGSFVFVGALSGVITAFDSLSFHITAECLLHEGSVTGLIHCYLGLASCGVDGQIGIWDLDSLECIRCFVGRVGALNCMASFKEILFCDGDENSIVLWKLEETPKIIHTLIGHTDCILALAVHQERLWSSSQDNTIRIWEMSSGVCVSSLNCFVAPVHLMLDCEGELILASVDGKLFRSIQEKVVEIAFSSTQSCVSLVCVGCRNVRVLWYANSNNEVQEVFVPFVEEITISEEYLRLFLQQKKAEADDEIKNALSQRDALAVKLKVSEIFFDRLFSVFQNESALRADIVLSAAGERLALARMYDKASDEVERTTDVENLQHTLRQIRAEKQELEAQAAHFHRICRSKTVEEDGKKAISELEEQLGTELRAHEITKEELRKVNCTLSSVEKQVAEMQQELDNCNKHTILLGDSFAREQKICHELQQSLFLREAAVDRLEVQLENIELDRRIMFDENREIALQCEENLRDIEEATNILQKYSRNRVLARVDTHLCSQLRALLGNLEDERQHLMRCQLCQDVDIRYWKHCAQAAQCFLALKIESSACEKRLVLDEIDSKKKKNVEKHKKLDTELNQQKQKYDDCQTELRSMKEQFEHCLLLHKEELETWKSQIHICDQKLQVVNHLNSKLQHQITEWQNQYEATIQQLDETNLLLKEYQKNDCTLRSEIETLSIMVSSLSSTRAELDRAVTERQESRALVASLISKYSERESVDSSEGHHQMLQMILQRFQGDLTKALDQVRAKENELSNSQEENERLHKELEIQRQRLRSLQNEFETERAAVTMNHAQMRQTAWIALEEELCTLRNEKELFMSALEKEKNARVQAEKLSESTKLALDRSFEEHEKLIASLQQENGDLKDTTRVLMREVKSKIQAVERFSSPLKQNLLGNLNQNEKGENYWLDIFEENSFLRSRCGLLEATVAEQAQSNETVQMAVLQMRAASSERDQVVASSDLCAARCCELEEENKLCVQLIQELREQIKIDEERGKRQREELESTISRHLSEKEEKEEELVSARKKQHDLERQMNSLKSECDGNILQLREQIVKENETVSQLEEALAKQADKLKQQERETENAHSLHRSVLQQCHKMETQFHNLETAHNSSENTVNELKTRCSKLQNENEQLKSNVANSSIREAELQHELDRCSARVQREISRVAELEKQVHEMEQDLWTSQRKNTQIEGEKAEITRREALAQSCIDELRRSMNDLEEKLMKLENELRVQATANDLLKADAIQLRKQTKQTSERAVETETTLEALQKELDQAREELCDSNHVLDEQSTVITALKAQLASKSIGEQKLLAAAGEVQALRSRCQSLESENEMFKNELTSMSLKLHAERAAFERRLLEHSSPSLTQREND